MMMKYNIFYSLLIRPISRCGSISNREVIEIKLINAIHFSMT